MFRTLDDYKKDKDKDKKKKTPEEEKKNVDWYAGGTSSGMAVTNNDDDVEKIVSKAKEDTSSGDGPGSEGIQLKITLYENGFTVDDAELREYEGDKNKQFIKELSEGYVPREIQENYKGKKVDVSLEDKRKEKYRPPTPPKYVAYSGEGVSMGATESVGLEVNKENGKPIIDDSKPTTDLQIRFHNGERQVVTFNLTHSVSDIFFYVTMAAPVDGSFQLVTGFPPKPIEDSGMSIEEAKLKSASITQKIV
jgi:UBX domain-containing protein 1